MKGESTRDDLLKYSEWEKDADYEKGRRRRRRIWNWVAGGVKPGLLCEGEMDVGDDKGLVKILKKYDKRTGALIRLPFIQKVLQQPFFTIDLLHKLVKECELTLNHLFPKKNEPSISGEAGGGGNGGQCGGARESKFGVPELEEIEYMESLYMKSSLVALRALKEIRSGSSTVSVFSLPPLQSSEGMEDRWNNIPVVQQAAK